jgi:MFS family permease
VTLEESTPAEDDDSIPISVRLGTVVPPEDPEDWTQPLTWVAALGMLAAPIAAFLWFWLAPPVDRSGLLPGTILIAVALVAGGVATGATQIGGVRAFAGTLGAALFGALATIIVGAAMAGERQLGAASPTLAHAFIGGLAGLCGALAASTIAPFLATISSRLARMTAPAGIGLAVAVVIAVLLA